MADERLQRFAVCVDDTDDLTKLTSTGAVCGAIAQGMMAEFDARVTYGITRHQLLLDPAVPYTSHNSSMCFVAAMPSRGAAAQAVEDIVGMSTLLLAQMCAASADPGLCVCPLPADAADDAAFAQLTGLVGFGRAAQMRVLAKAEAFDAAGKVEGLSLTEHGGTGDGVIGALAGVGLRLSGEDGRFRGTWDITGAAHGPGGRCTVLELRSWFLEHGIAVALLADGFEAIPDDDVLRTGPAAKMVLHGGQPVLLMERGDAGVWIPRDKSRLGKAGGSNGGRGNGEGGRGNGGGGRGDKGGPTGGSQGHGVDAGGGSGQPKSAKPRNSCPSYMQDVDEEEHTSDPTLQLCGSCLYRRLTENGFSCMRKDG